MDNLGHLGANQTNLRRLDICCLLKLIGTALGEANHEDAQQIAICGFNGNVRFDQSLETTKV